MTTTHEADRAVCPRPTRSGIYSRVLGLAVSLLLIAPCLQAKYHPPPTRTIKGAVESAAGKSVSGAEVELTDLNTGKRSAIYSDPDGRYEFDGLTMNDTFAVQAKFRSEASSVHKISFLEPRNVVVVHLRLHPPKK